VNPASEIYNEKTFRTQNVLFDLASPNTTDPSGHPYAFQSISLPGLPEGYLAWFDVGLQEGSTQHRLAYLRDAGFFSARRAQNAVLQFPGVDVAHQTLVFTRVTLRWAQGGSLKAGVAIVGMPLPPPSKTLTVRQLFTSSSPIRKPGRADSAFMWICKGDLGWCKQEEAINAVPVVLMAACVAILVAVRTINLVTAVTWGKSAPSTHLTYEAPQARKLAWQKVTAVATAIAEFSDVALMLIALSLLLTYHFVHLPVLRLIPDPQVPIFALVQNARSKALDSCCMKQPHLLCLYS
jgi:hypothetical protein